MIRGNNFETTGQILDRFFQNKAYFQIHRQQILELANWIEDRSLSIEWNQDRNSDTNTKVLIDNHRK